MENTNNNRLFYASCFALITTALSFSIRAGILPQLGEELSLSAEQLGFINMIYTPGVITTTHIFHLVYYGGKETNIPIYTMQTSTH